MTCVFCDICNRKAPADILMYWDWPPFEALAIRPLNPVTEGHTLFIPYVHVENAATNPFITGALTRIASQFAKERYDSFNIITSVGADATQTVMHLHIHLVPRRKDDGLHLPWTGQVRH